MEESLKDRSGLERTVMDISSCLINLESDELEGGITEALRSIGETSGLSHGYIYEFSDDRKSLIRTHAWSSGEGELNADEGKELFLEKFSWLEEKIQEGQIVYIPRVEALPPEAKAQSHFLRSKGSQSLILVPMVSGKLPVGFLGFESAHGEKTWSQEMIGHFRMAGEIFLNSLQRRRMAEEFKKIEEKYRNLVENINEVIFSLDTRGLITYISPMIQKYSLYAVDEMMGKPMASFIHPEDLPEFVIFLNQTLLGQSGARDFRLQTKRGSIREVRISSRGVLKGSQPLGLSGMLTDITERKLAQELLDSAEAKYRNIFANAVGGIFQCTMDGRFIVANPACARILGYASPEDLILQTSQGNRVYFVDSKCYKKFRRVMKEQGVIRGYEAQVYRKDGTKTWIAFNASAIRDPSGTVFFYEGTMEDITERRRADDQIRYLSFHDKLTGLYNRVYFEEELKRLDTKRQLPISVIIGDVNGLKLINDAFGHQEGDKSLTLMAKVLKESCRKEDIVARWGGDEFAILLPRTSYKVAMEIIERIKISCSQASQDPLTLSISLGAVTKENPSQDLQEIIKEAEERMYSSKLLEGKETLDSLFSSLRRTLFEKTHESQEHMRRLEELALRMGRALALPDDQLEDLRLLATAHDIGKVAIPEGILMKPGHWSAKEWRRMCKHPEIGYRIVKMSPELAPIAETVLAHHEWWNGRGYPRGLKGEKIPLFSRIIAIVDAFDVMTHARPQKEAMGPKEALQELRRKAGSQFDPNLVAIFDEIIGDAGNL